MQILLSLPHALLQSRETFASRPLPECVLGGDPPGGPLGTGGSTVQLLHEAYEKTGTAVDFSTWLASDRRIVIHAGGPGRQLPAYAPGGKSLMPVPVFRWAKGQRLDQTLLDLQLPLLTQILDEAPARSRVLVASGDVLVRMKGPLPPLPDADVVCLGLWVEPSAASHHGVFFLPRTSPDQLRFFLQKPSPQRISELAGEHLFLVDTGIWLLSERAVKSLEAKMPDAGCRMPDAGESAEEQAESRPADEQSTVGPIPRVDKPPVPPRQIPASGGRSQASTCPTTDYRLPATDYRQPTTGIRHLASGISPYGLYTDFGLSLGSEPTVRDDDISGLSVAVVPLMGGEFYHFGSNRDLIRSCLRLQNVVLDQRALSVTAVKPHPEMFTQNAKIEIPLEAHHQTLWIENSHVPSTWTIESQHIITGVPKNDWTLSLPGGMCLDAVPVGESSWCLRFYHLDDTFSGLVGDAATRWCGGPARDWFAARGLTLDEQCDIQDAMLFPVVELDAIDGSFVQWLVGEGKPRIDTDQTQTRTTNRELLACLQTPDSGLRTPEKPRIDTDQTQTRTTNRELLACLQTPDSGLQTPERPRMGTDQTRINAKQTNTEQLKPYLAARRMSASQLWREANVARLFAQREAMRRETLLPLARNAARSVFYQLDLVATAKDYAAAGHPLPEDEPADAPLMRRVCQRMFCANVLRNRAETGERMPDARCQMPDAGCQSTDDGESREKKAESKRTDGRSTVGQIPRVDKPPVPPTNDATSEVTSQHGWTSTDTSLESGVRSPEPDKFPSGYRLPTTGYRLPASGIAPSGLQTPDSFERSAFQLLAQSMISATRERKVAPSKNILDDQIIWARSPVRLDLAGGWTDTPPYCLLHGGSVVNVGVNLNGQPPIQVFVRLAERPQIVLRSIDLGVEERVTDYEELRRCGEVGSGFSIARAALALAGFLPEFSAYSQHASLESQLREFGGGIEISLLAAVPKGSGLGTSSILAATLLGALGEVGGLNWDTAEICRRTLTLEQMLTTGGGWQDQIGGLARGLKLIETQPGLHQDLVVRWLPAHLFEDAEPKSCMLLYYTGITRVAKNILAEIVRGMFLNSGQHLAILEKLGAHARDTYEVLLRGQWDGLCRSIARSWQLNQQLDGGTNTREVQSILERVEDQLAAVKLLGAGGGGYMLMMAKDPPSAARIRHTLAASPPNSKARFVEFEVSKTGLEITRS